MTITISTISAPVFVAIDISKLKHDVLVKHPDGKTNTFKVAMVATDSDGSLIYGSSWLMGITYNEP